MGNVPTFTFPEINAATYCSARCAGALFALIVVAITFPADAQQVIIRQDPNFTVVFQSDDWPTARGASDFGIPGEAQLKDVAIDPALQVLVDQLEHPSFDVREQATRALIESHPDRLQMYALLSRSKALSPEQRYRVLTALRESLLRTPRGAIGISMQAMQQFDNLGTIEIRVTDLIPGLPAEKVLKVGDRITQVDGRPLTMHDDLQFRVQCKKPGDTVRLTVKRAKVGEAAPPAVPGLDDAALFETVEFELQLGSAESLREFNQAAINQLNRFEQGLIQPASRVERNRMAEAKMADQALAPRPRTIPVEGASRLTEPPTSQRRILDPEVEQYPAIRELIWHRQRIQQQIVTVDELQMLTDQWQAQLIDLYNQSQDPSLSQDRREFLNRVIQRYLELLQP